MSYRTVVSAVPPGLAADRYFSTLIRGKGLAYDAAQFASAYLDTPEVAFTHKSAIEATDSTSALQQYGIGDKIIERAKSTSAFEQLKNQMFGVPFLVPVPAQGDFSAADWVAEGAPFPVNSVDVSSVRNAPAKFGVIVVMTRELGLSSAPSAMSAITKIITNSLSYHTDRLFLTPSLTAIAGLRPKSITSGATEIVSTGSSVSAVTANLAAMTAALTSWQTPYWILRQSTFAHLVSLNSGFISFNGGTPLLLGIPVKFSLGMPQEIVLVDLAAIAVSDDNGIEVHVSVTATLEMDTAPALGEQSPVTSISVLKSLFQNNLIAVRIARHVSWTRTSDTAVVWMATTY